MGCGSSAPTPPPASSHQSRNKQTPKQQPTAVVKPKKKTSLKKEDYIFRNLQEGIHVREPGSIAGEQFIIEDCANCDIFLLDHVAAVNIDGCSNVRIVIGACEGSIFIRDCSDCVLIAASQQVRTRKCNNLAMLLCTTTGPVIETSKKIRVGCFSYDYFGLEQNLADAGINEWDNHWYDVHDFTPTVGDTNFKYLASTVNHTILLNPGALFDLTEKGLAPAKGNAPRIIQSFGVEARGEPSRCGLIVTPCSRESKEEIRIVLDNWMSSHKGNVTVRTTVKVLSRSQLKDIQGSGLDRKVNDMLKIATEPPSAPDTCRCIGVEISGDDFERVERGLLLPGTILLSGPKALDRSILLFDEWKEKQNKIH